MTLKRLTLAAYVIALHAAFLCLAATLYRHQCQSDFHTKTVQAHVGIDGQVPTGAVVFIGDSIVQRLYTDSVVTPSVNYGIGSDTTSGVLARMGNYKSLSRASCAVLSVGVNDLESHTDANIAESILSIANALPCPVVVVGVLPVDARAQPRFAGWNARIRQINSELSQAAGGRLTFCDTSPLADQSGNLESSLHVGDGIHLSPAGYSRLVELLRCSLPLP